MSVASDRLADRRAVVRRTVIVAQQIWAELDPDAVGTSWAGLRPALVTTTTRGQTAAAGGAAAYVTASLAETGTPGAVGTDVIPAAFAGVASDGRPLDTLLDAAPLVTLRARSVGAAPAEAKATGLARLVDLLATQVHDAGRLADSAAIVATPAVAGYRRQLREPSCSRCIVLAGRFYRWNAGFARHPRCDCVHVPASRGDMSRSDLEPRRLFDRMSADEQDRIFTKAGAEAIRDGADVRQVVNARRGMRTTRAYGRDIRTTTVGTSTRALAGRRLAAAGARIESTRAVTSTTEAGAARRIRRVSTARLMPEQIYADALDRADALRLLRLHGFIV